MKHYATTTAWKPGDRVQVVPAWTKHPYHGVIVQIGRLGRGRMDGRWIAFVESGKGPPHFVGVERLRVACLGAPLPVKAA